MKTALQNTAGKVYLTIEFDELNGWIYNDWIGMLPTEDVMQGCLQINEVIRQTKCLHLLNDNRKVVGSWSAANEWIVQHWLPQALALGLQRFAHIVSPGIFGQASAAELYIHMRTKVAAQLFEDIAVAKDWLRQS